MKHVIQSNVAKQTTNIPTLSDQNVFWILHSTAINPDTEAVAKYDELSKCSDGTLWIQSNTKEFGCLAQGLGPDSEMAEGTNTLFFIHPNQMPNGHKATYLRIVCANRPEKLQPRWVRHNNEGNNGHLCSWQGKLVLLPPMSCCLRLFLSVVVVITRWVSVLPMAGRWRHPNMAFPLPLGLLPRSASLLSTTCNSAVDYPEDANPSPFQSIDCPLSPFESDGLFDANELGELSDLVGDASGEDLLWELYEMIGLPDDSLFNPDKEESFQNGFGVDMVSHGRYFRPVVHTAKRQDAFLASNVWTGPSPVLHGLPYNYTHQRKGRRHHFAEVIISTSIVARELGHESPIQYVKARGWTLSKQHKLNYRQIDEILFRNAPG